MPKAPRPKAINDLLNDPSNRRGKKIKEPKARKGYPPCCATIKKDPVAFQAWERLCSDLDSMGLLSSVDSIAIELLCKAYSRYKAAEAYCEEHGDIVLTKNDYPCLSPQAIQRDRAADQLKKFLIEFGLTPSARARLRYEDKGDNDGLSAFTLVG